MIPTNEILIRQWALHCILVLLVKNFDRYRLYLNSKDFLSVVDQMKDANWSSWDSNQAKHLDELLLFPCLK
jgi:hypothetical protein